MVAKEESPSAAAERCAAAPATSRVLRPEDLSREGADGEGDASLSSDALSPAPVNSSCFLVGTPCALILLSQTLHAFPARPALFILGIRFAIFSTTHFVS